MFHNLNNSVGVVTQKKSCITHNLLLFIKVMNTKIIILVILLSRYSVK